ncbi:MAG TPA: response regulator transcription factor [Caldilineaceae bacterium]|nr:response regulator transcription factor [Caldilineaceae bacterium]
MTDQPFPLYLMLVDDRAIIRRGLTAMLAPYPEIKILHEATTGEEAIRLCTHTRPHVVLTEINLPHINGLVVTRVIRERYPPIQVVIFTDQVDETLVHEAFTAGATGYVLKNASADEIRKAIHTVHQGRIYIDHHVTQCLIQVTTHHEATVGANLTDREREVLNLMVDGMTNNTIAKTLTVSQSTVKFHVSNILAKLQAKARTEAISVAMRHHLVN